MKGKPIIPIQVVLTPVTTEADKTDPAQTKPKPTPPIVTEEAKKLKGDLINMGFQMEYIESALTKSKPSDSLDQVIELVLKIQEEE